MTQKQKILKVLRERGQISNVSCFRGDYGFICLRLGSVINALQKEGKIKIKSKGFKEGTKDYVYYIQPVHVEELFVNGVKVGERYI